MAQAMNLGDEEQQELEKAIALSLEDNSFTPEPAEGNSHTPSVSNQHLANSESKESHSDKKVSSETSRPGASEQATRDANLPKNSEAQVDESVIARDLGVAGSTNPSTAAAAVCQPIPTDRTDQEDESVEPLNPTSGPSMPGTSYSHSGQSDQPNSEAHHDEPCSSGTHQGILQAE